MPDPFRRRSPMPQKRTQQARRTTADGVCPAVVTALDADCDHVRGAPQPPAGLVPARLAAGVPVAPARVPLASPYRPAEGDRVLVAEGDGELYVIGVLH